MQMGHPTLYITKFSYLFLSNEKKNHQSVKKVLKKIQKKWYSTFSNSPFTPGFVLILIPWFVLLNIIFRTVISKSTSKNDKTIVRFVEPKKRDKIVLQKTQKTRYSRTRLNTKKKKIFFSQPTLDPIEAPWPLSK